MEEILASIRRIISEDETPGAEAETPARAAPAAVAEPEPEPVAVVAPPEPVAAPVVSAPVPPPVLAVEEEEELELTEKLDSLGDLDIMDAEEPEPALQPVAALVSETVAAAAAASFGHLSASIAMPPSGLTLDDVVRELLRPLLRQWLDANLPTIVQEAVQAEVDRIARSRLR
jgi:cell pole-organizing protein PopZ